MRYYEFALGTNSEEIKSGAKINLRDYSYDNSINAMNTYMLRNMDNNITFFAYREEGKTTLASFSYDEQKGSLADVYDHITGILDQIFSIRKIAADPVEITSFEFMDDLNEAVRREFMQMRLRVTDTANLWLWSYYRNDQKETLHYDLQEYVIPDGAAPKLEIYDNDLLKELSRIEENSSAAGCGANMVHYVLSARSPEAVRDMTGSLMQSLYMAGRISSRRMGVIREIEPDAYKCRNHLEDLIENSYGGVVVFDLTEKYGKAPADYVMMSKYIVNLLKEYRNHCLFVFTYDMDNPGFSYLVLPEINKYVMTVALREGKSDRKNAVKYLKNLISASEYSEYAAQAGEFLKQFAGDEFTQTDVLSALERFGPWCINRNVFKMYDFDVYEGFMLDRNEMGESAYDKLKSLIGLDIVKKEIDRIIDADIVEKERKKHRGRDYQAGSMHMIFGGNPGTAKTTVAKLFAGIVKEKGILKSGAFVERSGLGLDGILCVENIRDAFVAAKGGVLFIDEAYSMKSDSAVTALIQEMENRRDEVIVILAGYNERMKYFLELNEGLKSRIPHWVDFPDYSEDELTEIFKLMLAERGLQATDEAIYEAKNIFAKVRFLLNFGNGRYARNLLDKAVENQSARLLSEKKRACDIRKKELFLIKKEDITELDDGLRECRAEGTAMKELDDMIGLASVKEVIHKAVAKYKYNKLCIEKGLTGNRVSLHMVFTGNPGTAKTTVARLFAEIMRDEKVLPSGQFVEVGRADIVGVAVGSTPKIVKHKFMEARGGVLFIDEAYSLCDAVENCNGDEAIDAIVQEMENHRDDVIVIFAGYPGPMKEFLERNPGMLSRIAFHVEFDDYSEDELCRITRLMVEKKKMSITEEAMDKLKTIYKMVSKSEDFGNGRFVRKTLEEAEMNLAQRLMEKGEKDFTIRQLTTIDGCDIPDADKYNPHSSNKIGFY